MNDDVQPLFPVPSCVLFGRRRATAKSLQDKVRAYSGDLPERDVCESIADASLQVMENARKPVEGQFKGGSTYRKLRSSEERLIESWRAPAFLCRPFRTMLY